jgi:hypothetical protein
MGATPLLNEALVVYARSPWMWATTVLPTFKPDWLKKYTVFSFPSGGVQKALSGG